MPPPILYVAVYILQQVWINDYNVVIIYYHHRHCHHCHHHHPSRHRRLNCCCHHHHYHHHHHHLIGSHTEKSMHMKSNSLYLSGQINQWSIDKIDWCICCFPWGYTIWLPTLWLINLIFGSTFTSVWWRIWSFLCYCIWGSILTLKRVLQQDFLLLK